MPFAPAPKRAVERGRAMVPIVEPILNELREETVATRRLLERVPTDKLAWRPHHKSRPLGELAMHVANIPGMAERIVKHDEFSPTGGPPAGARSTGGSAPAFDSTIPPPHATLPPLTPPPPPVHPRSPPTKQETH